MITKVLPTSHPLIKGYLHIAYQMSILGTYPEAQPWIFQNYIQLVSDENNPLVPIQFYLPDSTGYNWSPLCPLFESQSISRELINNYNIDFLELVIESIAKDWYVYCFVNEKYIPFTRAEEQQFDFNHQIMLNGYNKSERIVSFSGYDKNKQYSNRWISFDKLADAYSDNTYNYELFESKLVLFRLRKDVEISFKLDFVVEQLTDFVESRGTVRNVMDYDRGYKLRYGLETYNCLIENLNLMAAKEKTITLVPIHVLMEHKLLMVERLKFIELTYPQFDLSVFISEYLRLENDFLVIRNQLLKMKLTGNLDEITTIVDRIKIIKEEERTLLYRLIEQLTL